MSLSRLKNVKVALATWWKFRLRQLLLKTYYPSSRN
jgi:hypothetical protein